MEGIFLEGTLVCNFGCYLTSAHFKNSFNYFVFHVLDTAEGAIKYTVDGAKNAANDAIDSTKTFVDSSKGSLKASIITVTYVCVCAFVY